MLPASIPEMVRYLVGKRFEHVVPFGAPRLMARARRAKRSAQPVGRKLRKLPKRVLAGVVEHDRNKPPLDWISRKAFAFQKPFRFLDAVRSLQIRRREKRDQDCRAARGTLELRTELITRFQTKPVNENLAFLPPVISLIKS